MSDHFALEYIYIYIKHEVTRECILLLTLALLNTLRCHAHFSFKANQITWSGFLTEIHIFNVKECRSRSVGFFRSQLILIYKFAKTGHVVFSKRRVNHTGRTYCFMRYMHGTKVHQWILYKVIKIRLFDFYNKLNITEVTRRFCWHNIFVS